MRVQVQFWCVATDQPMELVPYNRVIAMDQETKAPIRLEVIDDCAEESKIFSEFVMLPFDNLLAVRQYDGTWDLREQTGKCGYKVFHHWRIVEVG